MSEEDLTNYKTYISDLDITKYIVLDKENNYWYSAEYVDKMLKKQDAEVERLNKIIYKLEEFIEKEIELYTIELTERNKGALGYTAPIKGVYKEIYNVLQELKGSESNE